jgi:hypothetical protein
LDFTTFSADLDEFRTAYATANTGSEKIFAAIRCMHFLLTIRWGLANPPKDSLAAAYLDFLKDALLSKWLALSAAKRYSQPELRELAITVDGAFLAFAGKKFADAEEERGRALTETERNKLIEDLDKSLVNYIDAEFPCELVESGDEADEIVEEPRRRGRPRKYEWAEKAINHYIDLWTSHHVGEPCTARSIDKALVEQVRRDLGIKDSYPIVRRIIKDELARQTGEETYPLKITLTLSKKWMADISTLAQANRRVTAKLSPRETVRAALGLPPLGRKKRT